MRQPARSDFQRLHLDDFGKFREDHDGGRDYETHGLLQGISSGDSIGFGYEFVSRSVLFTYNSTKSHNPSSGVYIPSGQVQRVRRDRGVGDEPVQGEFRDGRVQADGKEQLVLGV